MPTYVLDKDSSKLFVWSYKEGLLSKIAHDLCILATQWEAPLEVDGDQFTVNLSVDVAGLKIQGVVKDGEVVAMKPKDTADIEGDIVGKKVLLAGKYPQIRFTGKGSRAGNEVEATGELTLRDATRPLNVKSKVEDADGGFKVTGEIRFKQSDFGMKPFSAMLGTIKVQDELRVTWDLAYRPA